MVHSIFYEEVEKENKPIFDKGDTILINMYGCNPEIDLDSYKKNTNSKFVNFLIECQNQDIQIKMYNIKEEVFKKWFGGFEFVQLIS